MAIDIYFDSNYGKLYEKIENGKVEIYRCETKDGIISNQFIKREIPIKVNGEVFYDIITPYGYGGPIIEECNGNKEKLINTYKEEFEEYCIKNNIVSEFIRFHPICNNAEDFKHIYDVVYMRKTLCTNLKDYDNPVDTQFSKSCRKNIRRALNKGITYQVTKSPNNIEEFKEIYYSTMDRNNATDYYYFDDEYFSNILEYFKDNIIVVKAIFEEKIIAMGLYFIYNKTIHIHLSGTLTEYLYLSPAYILRYAVTLWGKENGYEYIHHGGGRSNSQEDTLYLFKKSFSQLHDYDFCIGKKIYNEKIYNKLCEIREVDKNEAFFPAYRKE